MYESEFIFEYCDVFTVGARDRTEDAARAFIHKVYLEGSSEIQVHVMATFDDGALVNVIDTVVFEAIKDKLSPLQASKRVLRMANGTLVPSGGTWIGRIIVGNVCAEGAFEIFPSGGAWDMLFGKPMLHAFDATHKYTGDTVILNSKDDSEILQNSNPEPVVTRAKRLHKNKVAVAQVSNLGERFGVSPLRLRQVRDYFAHCISDNALAPITELDESDDIGIKCRAKRRLKRREQLKRQHERSAKANTLKLLWTELTRAAAVSSWVLRRCIQHAQGTRRNQNKTRLHHWYNLPWDFGEKKRDEADTKDGGAQVDSEPNMVTRSHRATVEDCAVEGLQKTKVTVASDSNPGAHDHAAPLTTRHVPDRSNCDPFDRPSTQGSDNLFVDDIHQVLEDLAPGTEQTEILIPTDNSIFTRATEPFKPERVAEILRLVEIGADISHEERQAVKELIKEFADVYALSVNEVKHIPGATHRLEIPEDAKFSTKIRQRPMSPPQTAYFSKALDVMLEAGICAPIAAKDVKCVSPITLAVKAHTSAGMTVDELRQRLNQECHSIGIAPPFIGPSDAEPLPDKLPASKGLPEKWRVCTNYMKLNEVTQVLQMPQGNIRTKQQALSGHQWISIFNFAAGFYMVEIAKESRPYTAFYVEGRGYFVYCRMPFGLTGAPSCFNEVTAQALHGLVGTIMQLFVNDGAMAGDIFADKLANLRIFLTRCREQSLSISPQKTKLFMSEVVFAGERVGTEGIRGDLSKLTAVVNWEVPTTIQNLEAFLGLTGYFRPLIKNYSLLEKPLKDLTNLLDVPKGGGKQSYRNAARAHRLEDHWTSAHDKAFVVLKIALTSAPVVKGPKYDGTHFIVTTDGCKDGFAGVLSQRFEWTDAKGNSHTRIHPILFTSKRTSDSETRYQPYLLEFAALKHSLDKFSAVIGGYPVEIETDCQALRDTIINNKLNATHARWLDGIMGHHIVDCRHRPGKQNQAADGLSRQFTDTPRRKGDGHEWTVDPAWAANTGLVHDIWTTQLDEAQSLLHTRFASKPIFLEVIDAMYNVDHGQRVHDKRWACH